MRISLPQKVKMYLLIVNYYSRFIEIVSLTTIKVSRCDSLPKIDARKIWNAGIAGNRPQFIGGTFSSFTTKNGFRHVISSTRYPQSNGEAKQAIQTITF